jgi:hypothetical protein
LTAIGIVAERLGLNGDITTDIAPNAVFMRLRAGPAMTPDRPASFKLQLGA